MKRAVGFVAALILGLIGSASALGDAAVTIMPDANTVGRYNPATVSINVGETITWMNQGVATHTITRCTGSPCEFGNGGDGFDSGNVNVGSSFSKKFGSPGTHNYYCKIHPAMRGTVSVAGAAGGAAPPSGGGAQPPAGKSTPARSRPTPSTSPTTASDPAAPTEAASGVSAPVAQPPPSPASTVRTAAESSGGFPVGIVIAVIVVAVAAVGTVMWRLKKSPS